MKTKISVLALILVLTLGMSSFQAQAFSTPAYLGQTTWSLLITANTGDPSMVGTTLTMTGGITKVGDNYYLFQGTMMYGSTLDVLSGGGGLVSNKLILSVTNSAKSDEGFRISEVMHFILNQSDLSGSVTAVGTGYIDTGFANFYFAATVTRTGPMIPLTSGAAGMSLLLD